MIEIARAELKHFGGPRCPEAQPLTGAIRACLDTVGENFGFLDSGGWRLDRGTALICVLSGEAFGGDASELCDRNTLKNSMSGIRTLMDALGYEYEICTTDPARADYLPKAETRARIAEQLGVLKRPFVTDGFWNPPMGFAVTGYDEAADALLGWNYHVFAFNPDPAPIAERKEGWYEAATFFLFFGKRVRVPEEAELFRRGISEAEGYEAGANADFYDELLRFLGQSEDECVREAMRTHKIMGYSAPPAALFEDAERVREEFQRVADPLWCCVSERRYYAAHFFRMAKEVFPKEAEALGEIAISYDRQSALFGKEYIREVGHDPVDREKFRDPAVRARMAEVVRAAKAEEARAALLLRQLNHRTPV